MSLIIEPVTTELVKKAKHRGFNRTVFHERPQAAVGIAIVAVLAGAAIFAPLLTSYDPRAQTCPLHAAPSAAHWLGCDAAGHDMYTLLLYGIRVSLVVGLAAAFVAIVIGGAVGIISGYFGGRTDTAAMAAANLFLVIPEVPLMVVLASLLGQSLFIIIVVIGVLLWAGTSRIIRAQVKSVRERVYVKRARSVGAGNTRIIIRHIVPQVAPLMLANAVLIVAVAIFDETFLAFLGLGDPTAISLGKLIEEAFDGQALLRGEWWVIVPPGVLVTLLILGCTLYGQALEDALNPRLKVSFLSPKSFRVRRDITTKKKAAMEPNG